MEIKETLFKNLTDDSKPENKEAADALGDANYFQTTVNYDEELTILTENINKKIK